MPRCHWIDDITYMKKPEPPALLQVMPCTKDAQWVRYDNGIVVEGFCESHMLTRLTLRNELFGNTCVLASANYLRDDLNRIGNFERYSDAKFYGAEETPNV